MNIFYPPICGICGKFNSNYLCPKCNLILKNQAKFAKEEYEQQEKYIENHIYIFQYQGIIRKKIINYKFKEQSYLYLTFVNFLLKNDFFFENFKTYDTMIPVPISPIRKNERGYNQSLLIAKELVKQIHKKYPEQGIQLGLEYLYKPKNIVPQSTLNKQDRLENVKDVYQLKNGEQLKNKKILLIDDIYTTGSTVSECAKVLKQTEVKKIDVFTIAKD